MNITEVEEWAPIEDFPGYSVSTLGRVRNDRDQRIMALTRNQLSIVKVALFRDGQQWGRAVTPLVARAFLTHANPAFDTPIHLDGDRSNNHADNLMWRPRWFAVAYHKQFTDPNLVRGTRAAIRDIDTGEIFESSWQAAIKFGLLDKQIKQSIYNLTYVFPTYQRFAWVEN